MINNSDTNRGSSSSRLTTASGHWISGQVLLAQRNDHATQTHTQTTPRASWKAPLTKSQT